MTSTPVPAPSRDRLVRGVTLLGGVAFVGFGLWAYVAPESFFEAAAAFDPYNPHFLRDMGAFQIGLGAVLLLSLVPTSTATIVLGGTGLGAAFHAVGHVIDHDLGGSPASDIPTFSLLAIVLLATAWYARDNGRP